MLEHARGSLHDVHRCCALSCGSAGMDELENKEVRQFLYNSDILGKATHLVGSVVSILAQLISEHSNSTNLLVVRVHRGHEVLESVMRTFIMQNLPIDVRLVSRAIKKALPHHGAISIANISCTTHSKTVSNCFALENVRYMTNAI